MQTVLRVAESVPAQLVDLGEYRRTAQVEKVIGACRGTFGLPLSALARGLVRAAIAHPTDESWDEAHGVTVTSGITLWEAVLTYTEYDVTVSPRFVVRADGDGFMRMHRTSWQAIPTSAQIIEALTRLHAGRSTT